ncbi:MAG: IS3 family transposase [Ruminococcus sp.]|uniref:IS3 family transposase n=1 Tax=Ruminococcus sp. TaxID=41978 RepID=UPI0025F50B3D|nr:IS3 family transposase [Ruminococcus sp.]MCR5599315.1 IS3 family transposase [Ruminococcus sp.]
MVKIQGILSEHPDNKNYGVRRMQAALARKGTHVSLRTVYRTMSESGLIHRHRRPHGMIWQLRLPSFCIEEIRA